MDMKFISVTMTLTLQEIDVGTSMAKLFITTERARAQPYAHACNWIASILIAKKIK